MTKTNLIAPTMALALAMLLAPGCMNGESHRGGEAGESRGHAESEEGEESGRRLTKSETWDEARRGAHLTLAFDGASRAFTGSVKNTTAEALPQVRVEVHLSDGVELGPTPRKDLAPGESMAVELSASGQEFEWWTTHPESGNEEGHGPGHEEGGEGRGEHGERGEGRGEHGGRREGGGEHREGGERGEEHR